MHNCWHVLASWFICARGLCRVRGTTGWETPGCSCKEEQLLWVGRRIFSLFLNHIGSIQQSSQSALAHHIFLSVFLGTRKYSQKAIEQQLAAGNSWLSQMSLSNIPAAGSAECHSELVCLWSHCLRWWPCSISEFSQRKAGDTLKENWMKYFIPSSMWFVTRDRRLCLSSAKVSNCKGWVKTNPRGRNYRGKESNFIFRVRFRKHRCLHQDLIFIICFRKIVFLPLAVL